MDKTTIDILQCIILTGSAVILKEKTRQENAYWELRKAGLINTTTETDYHRVIKLKNHKHEWDVFEYN